jgi:hypothetical protein
MATSHVQVSWYNVEVGITSIQLEERAMIVLGLSASLIASMTLFAIAVLNRLDDSRQKVTLRVL